MFGLTDPEYKLLCKELFIEDGYFLHHLIGSYLHTIIDIGANVGLFSLYARALFPKVRIVAIEPHPDNFKRLNETVCNIQVETYNFALGDGKPVKMVTGDPGGKNPSVSAKTKTCEAGIPSFSLQHLIHKMKIDPHENVLIKIDCEGAERFLYNDLESEKILNSCSQWAMEIHYDKMKWPQSPTWEQWQKWLDKMEPKGCYLKRRLIAKYGIGGAVKCNYLPQVQ